MASEGVRSDPAVRVPPATGSALGWLPRLAAALAARATGARPRVFTTLGRHRRLFRRWLPFAAGTLLRTDLPRADVELLILRTAWNCGAWYEWTQHACLAGRAGLSSSAVERVVVGPEAAGWSPRQRLLLTAVDELHDGRVIRDGTWVELEKELGLGELIELPFVVGHYEMLAMALNSLGVDPEPETVRRLSPPAAASAERLRRSLFCRRADAGTIEVRVPGAEGGRRS